MSELSVRRMYATSANAMLKLCALVLVVLACGNEPQPPHSSGGAGGSLGGTEQAGRSGSSGLGGVGGRSEDGGESGSDGGWGGDAQAGTAGEARGGEGGDSRGGEDHAGDGGQQTSAGTGGRGASAGSLGAGGAASGGVSGSGGSAVAGGTGGDAGAGGLASGGSADSGGSGGGAGTVDPGPECELGEKEICDTTPGKHGGCFQSIRMCTAGAWGACRPMPGEQMPGGEACNGEDEDCDGEIDEDLGEVSCGMGACRTTVSACTNGVLGICKPLQPQTSTDGCNGIDDDCDGAIDEDCPDCVHVAPDGNDEAALASGGSTPFQNVQTAIDFAAASGAARVCVAAGAACGASATFPGPAASDLTMQDGVSVLASYESSGWTRCNDSTTSLAPATARGVYFPPSIVRPTSLDGFIITRAIATTTAAVTVEGGRAVTLSNLRIINSVAATNSYGVNLTNGAEAAIVQSRIEGGTATQESIGVRSVGSRVQLEDNCTSTDATTGRCGGSCAIRGNARGAVSIGVALDDAPGSSIERSHICAENGNDTIAGVRLRGDSAGVVLRGNAINGLLVRSSSSHQTSVAYGIELTDCGGAAPWLVDNAIQVTPSFVREMARGVTASGACHPVIESSVINAGIEQYATPQRSAVVHCGSAAGISSRCVIAGNQIAGIGGGHTTAFEWSLTGIDCAAGGCAKISRNTVVGRRHSEQDACQAYCNAEVTALRVESGGPFIDRNDISLGCAERGSIVSLSASWSRFQNNRVQGKSCPWGTYRRYGRERVLDVRATEDLDIHSNRLWGGGPSSELCTSSIDSSVVLWGGGTRSGTFRNNWLGSKNCVRSLFVEANAASDPAVFENNSLVPVSPLYVDEAVTKIETATGLNGMTDIVCSGNILGDQDDFYQKDKGTPAGAPLWDFHGNPRDDTPSIGAIEL